jgi:hypothetical protein
LNIGNTAKRGVVLAAATIAALAGLAMPAYASTSADTGHAPAAGAGGTGNPHAVTAKQCQADGGKISKAKQLKCSGGKDDGAAIKG